MDHAEPDDAREQALRLLSQALGLSGRIPSGYAITVCGHLRSGRLVEGFVLMVEYSDRTQARRARPREYWGRLLAAANLLAGTGNDKFEPCVSLCRTRLEELEL